MIYLDSCIVIYWVEEKIEYLQTLKKAFTDLTSTENIAYSPLVQLECLVYPYRTNNQALLARYQQFFSFATCLSLPSQVFENAAKLRAIYPSLKTPDALHLACAQFHHCNALWTNDNRLIEISHNLAINITE